MTTITDKKQYPGEQYLNELITNIEFAARAPVEVVRAMAAELQKRREADSAEPASNHEELPLDYLQGQKDGLEWAAQLAEANHPQTGDWLYDDPVELAKAIRKGPDMPEAAGNSPVTPDGWISCSERMPVIGELNWRTSFPLLVTCEIGVIPAYYGFVSVNGDRHYGFMESLKYGDDNGNHPQTNEYGLISNVTHWMPLPERRRRLTVANLQLAVKGEYFDAMIRGEKTEEYRLCNDYWNKRIMFREYDRLIITKGYPKRDDSSRRIDVPYGGYEVKTITHPHFGDKPIKVYAIKVNIDG